MKPVSSVYSLGKHGDYFIEATVDGGSSARVVFDNAVFAAFVIRLNGRELRELSERFNELAALLTKTTATT